MTNEPVVTLWQLLKERWESKKNVIGTIAFTNRGTYLAQLYEYEKLLDFIASIAPAEPVLNGNETGMLSAPAHPEVFFNLQVLPEEIALEPLINVHKQRLIAAVIKSFVGGQDLATNMPFEVDQKWYRDCFRMRSLTPEALHSVASKFST
ncbi:hypothetical protein M422DRAFT_783838 [Sphaerobolus stellatus SS14]|uniref:Uncharacterized protein n=1 Tax=Sphaerobolus stellatus (strain SS14) TaxID=990650 RepID=A0A0C9TMI8_SPHS4|nr:hypothetical protein M422DRAFT_783838 [Sphaerobolus stellatus SS14]